MPEHEAYVWEGRALDIDEFNVFFQPWLKRQASIRGAGLLTVKALPEPPPEAVEPEPPLTQLENDQQELNTKLKEAALLAGTAETPKGTGTRKRKNENSQPSSSGSKLRRTCKPRAEPGA
jgi:hypothetical protein